MIFGEVGAGYRLLIEWNALSPGVFARDPWIVCNVVVRINFTQPTEKVDVVWIV